MGRQVTLAGDLDPATIAKLMETPGGRLRFMRLTKGVTQVATAKRVNVSQPMVSQWERNEWLPSVDVQHELAEYFGTTRTFLFGDSAARKHREQVA